MRRLQRYYVPSGSGVAPHGCGALYKKADVDARIEALEAQHANDCEMIARLREVLSGRTLDETHESFWKEKVRQLEAALESERERKKGKRDE